MNVSYLDIEAAFDSVGNSIIIIILYYVF